MKRMALTILIVFGICRTDFAQGTISFQNFNAQVGGRVYVDSVLAPAGYHVELLYGPLGSSGFFLSNSARVFNNTATGGGQFFDGTTVILSNITAGTGSGDTNNVMLQLRGWTGPYSDWNSAITSGSALLGFTAVFSNPTGGAGTALPANMVGWVANNPLVFPTPEPSTIAVGGLGGAVFLLFRRQRRASRRS